MKTSQSKIVKCVGRELTPSEACSVAGSYAHGDVDILIAQTDILVAQTDLG